MRGGICFLPGEVFFQIQVLAENKDRMFRCLITLLLLVPIGLSAEQTSVEVLPSELSRIPGRELGMPYWQQLAITLGHDDVPGDSTIVVVMPKGVVAWDGNGDGRLEDEIRVVYAAVGDETPGFFISQASNADTIVVSSGKEAAAGGVIYLQFPVLALEQQQLLELLEPVLDAEFPDLIRSPYQQISFGDAREDTISPGPELTIVSKNIIELQGSMNTVFLGGSLAAGQDTSTTPSGLLYPDEAEVVVLELPDLIFDGGVSSTSNLVLFGDRDDANDMNYRFFFSPDPALLSVSENNALEVLDEDGRAYLEREGQGRRVRLLTRDLPEGTYYLYATSNVTGEIPLVRSRPLQVRHQPLVEYVGPIEAEITLDTGGLYDLEGRANGRGQQRAEIEFAVLDYDDSAEVHLFYSDNPGIGKENIVLTNAGTIASLLGANPATPAGGLTEDEQKFTWDIRQPELVPAGSYYIYGVAGDGKEHHLKRSENLVHVLHSPSLYLDALVDGLHSPADTIHTGGLRPQRFLSFTWGRSGSQGDEDLDGDASISLYYSTVPATIPAAPDSFMIPGGRDQLMSQIDSTTHLIATGIREDPDRRIDNQYVWDLWDLEREGKHIPEAGEVYYVYGLIEDDVGGWLAQLNRGRLNDGGAAIVFDHAPPLRPLQPVADIKLGPGSTATASWDDMDLDDDAAIRVLLSREDHGNLSVYSTVVSGTAFVVNSADGRAQPEVDPAFDLSEDSQSDSYDLSIGHLQHPLSGSTGLEDGIYHLYMAIEEGEVFGEHTRAWRAPGKVVVEDVDGTGSEGQFRLVPEVFAMGIKGMRQGFELRVDAAGDSVDLVVASLRLDTQFFQVVDQDLGRVGIQPFKAGPDFDDAKLVVNEFVAADDNMVSLALGYLDPAGIYGLESRSSLVELELISLDREGAVSIELDTGEESQHLTRLEHRGAVVGIAETGPLSTGTLLSGRNIAGNLILEGRSSMAAEVDFSLRPWASYEVLQDSAFAAVNDVNEEREGVQVLLQESGDFVLQQVPAGRLDLYVHLDGFLDAWAPGLEISPAQDLDNVRPTSTGDPADSLMLGGDVAGYTDLEGRTQPDNEVTLADWDYVASLFGRTIAAVSDSSRADINGDGEIGLPDLSLVAANFLGQGPRPVYKIVPIPAAKTVLQVLISSDEITAGREIEVLVRGEGFAGVRSYDVELLFDPAQWAVVNVDPGAEVGEVLMAHRITAAGWRVAASLPGRQRDFGGAEILLRWQLKALADDPEKPRLRPVLVLDRQDRPVALELLETKGGSELPNSHALAQNFPNPFNPSTIIPFAVEATKSPVQLEIFNPLGQRIDVLWNGYLPSGDYRMSWNGRDREGRPVASGVYLYRLQVGSSSWVKQMLLLR